MQDLGTMGGTASYATALNNRGDVAGYLVTAAGPTHAFVALDGQMMDLGVGTGVSSKAVGLNDLRQVLVVSTDSKGNASSWLWQNGQTTALTGLGGSSTAGGALNNLGQVAGAGLAPDGSTHVFVDDTASHQPTDLGDLGGKGAITHLNEVGQATGILVTARGANIAFMADLTNPSNSLGDIYIDVGLNGTDAYWINNENTIVGAGELPGTPPANAGIWTADGNFTNLNTQALPANSGWALLAATGINDAGIIVGRAMAPDGTTVAYMLSVPGPALAADKAMTIVQDLTPAIAVITKGADAAAKASAPSTLPTALTDLQQAELLLMPAAGQTTLDTISSGRASHLLKSARNLLSNIPDGVPYLTAADRDSALASISAAQNALQ
jgi:probable HAF family extracellular repeat protein